MEKHFLIVLRRWIGNLDCLPVLRQRLDHRLLDPPRAVRRKPAALAVVESLNGFDQADIALVDQVQERHTPVLVFLRN